MGASWCGTAGCSPATKTGSHARSRLRARASPDEPARAGLLPAQQRLDRPAANHLALVDAEGIAVKQILASDHALPVDVDDPQVGVESRRDISFVHRAKPFGDVRGSDRGDRV